ncbi:MAG TPA: Na+/H+ antiporter [Solirubrobacterales bacterium]
MDNETELVLLGLLVAVPAFAVLARALDVPYPIVLVIGALPLGFIPGMPEVELDPDLVLVIFLPPLLYVASFFANLRDLRRDARPIGLLAIGLVALTTVAVAVAAHFLIDGLPWAAAFALGAIVSPTDPLAATAIARRLGAPRRWVGIIEGESLINDATALILYRVAVAAAVGGTFSALDASLEFVASVAGGIAIGLVVGYLVSRIRARLEDPPVEITISLFTGYAAYLPAEELGASGVLAAVTAGVYLGWLAPRISSANVRMQSTAVWEFIVFLFNGVLFMLVGLQLPSILEDLDGNGTGELIGYAAAICAVVVAARFAWLFTVPYLIRSLDRRPSQVERRVGGSERLAASWAGMRGAVTLAAALALPLTTDAGEPFPERDLLIFLAYAVVVFTVVGQGLTLPALMRRLDIVDDGKDEETEELLARVAASDAAIARLDELADADWTRPDTVDRVRRSYGFRRSRFAARTGEIEDRDYERRSQSYQRLLHEVIQAQREVLLRLRDDGEISGEVMRRVERELDLEENRLEI